MLEITFQNNYEMQHGNFLTEMNFSKRFYANPKLQFITPKHL